MIAILRERLLVPLGEYGLMVTEVIRDIFRRDVRARDVFKQAVIIGNHSLLIIFLTNVFTGMVMALQTAYGLQRFGAKMYVGNIVALAQVRELGPVLTAIMLCGRVGAGIAAELASMVVTEQVDAIKALGANPVRKLVSPRVLAAIIVVPLITVLADFIGILGGALVAILELNITWHSYLRSVITFVTIKDVVDGLIKAGVFGFLLVSIACYKGMHARGGTEGVGIATTEAVVTGSILILVTDFFLTKLLLLFG